MNYILAKRIKSNKWQGIAGNDSAGCLAEFNDIVSNTLSINVNIPNEYRTSWGIIEKQKNYIGRAPDFKII